MHVHAKRRSGILHRVENQGMRVGVYSVLQKLEPFKRRLTFFLCFFLEIVFLLSLCPFPTPNPHLSNSDCVDVLIIELKCAY
jgi:hypothetical protein